MIHPARATFIYTLVALFLFFEMALQVSPGIMTQYLIKDLNLSIFGLGLVSGAYFVTYTSMQIPAGLLYDRFNIRLVIVLPLVTCCLGALLFANASNATMAAVARMLMGSGSAFAFIGVLVVAAEVFPSQHFALITGITQMLAALGAMCGTLPLVPLIHHFGWRNSMWLFVYSGLSLALLIWLFVRYQQPQVGQQKQLEQSLRVNLKYIVRNKQTWLIAIYACCLWAPMAAFASLYGQPFLMHYFHLSTHSSASLIMLMWIGIAVGSPVLGFISDYMGKRRLPLRLAALLGLICFNLLLLMPTANLIWLTLLLLGAGASCAGQALSFALIKDNNSAQTKAAAIGFNNMAVVLAGFIFQPLVGWLIENHAPNKTLISGNDYHFGLIAIALCYGIGFVVTFFIKERKHD